MGDDFMLLRRTIGNLEKDDAAGHHELTEIANDCTCMKSGGIHQYINKCMGGQSISLMTHNFGKSIITL
jgi:hypothetical protein